MNWEAIGAIGEILGALAVFASLIYLALQIRQNSRFSQAATRQAISESIMAPPLNAFSNSEFVNAFNRMVHGEELDRDQLLRLQAYCYITLRSWENIHYQFVSGLLSDEEWSSFRFNLKSLFQTSLYRDYWEREADVYTRRFREVIDGILAELVSAPKAVPRSVIFPQDAGPETETETRSGG